MVNHRCLYIRLTTDQHSRIRNKAVAKGYKTVAQFIRSSVLEDDSSFERKFDEMYHTIVNTNSSNVQIKRKEKPLMAFIE